MARTLAPSESSPSPTNPAGVAPATRIVADVVLRLVVFTGGAVSIGTELAASRLLAPFFGTSTYIWATIIGLVLIFLSIGYVIGGRLADRFPDPNILYAITAVAAFLVGLVPVLSRPILAASLEAFSSYAVGAFVASLIGCILLFSIPVTMLGVVSPFAIRLSMRSLAGAGNTAGGLYALGTFGSIIGTFVPTFLLIPRIGSARTFYLFSVILLAVSAAGFLSIPSPARRRGLMVGTLVLLALSVLLAAVAPTGFVRPVEGDRTEIYQGESVYNFIQVVRNNATGANELVLNEGHAIHSLYYPGAPGDAQPLSRGPWDYFAVAPFVVPGARSANVKNVAVLGLAAGTVVKRMTQAYGPQVRFDGVEIDPQIVEVGQRYFNMNDANLNVVVEDARYFLKTTDSRYDVIAVDAYKQPYIPFHLVTQEFFAEAKSHLTPNGVFVVNAGRTATDYRLVEVISQTMRSVFPKVFTVDTAGFNNTIIIATTNPDATLADFARNIAAERAARPDSPVIALGDAAMANGNMTDVAPGPKIFTDDYAPVEDLIDSIIIDVARRGR